MTDVKGKIDLHKENNEMYTYLITPWNRRNENEGEWNYYFWTMYVIVVSPKKTNNIYCQNWIKYELMHDTYKNSK